jgi:hypothetical protein
MGNITRGFPYRADYTASDQLAMEERNGITDKQLHLRMSVLVATLDIYRIMFEPLIWCMARE